MKKFIQLLIMGSIFFTLFSCDEESMYVGTFERTEEGSKKKGRKIKECEEKGWKVYQSIEYVGGRYDIPRIIDWVHCAKKLPAEAE